MKITFQIKIFHSSSYSSTRNEIETNANTVCLKIILFVNEILLNKPTKNCKFSKSSWQHSTHILGVAIVNRKETTLLCLYIQQRNTTKSHFNILILEEPI